MTPLIFHLLWINAWMTPEMKLSARQPQSITSMCNLHYLWLNPLMINGQSITLLLLIANPIQVNPTQLKTATKHKDQLSKIINRRSLPKSNKSKETRQMLEFGVQLVFNMVIVSMTHWPILNIRCQQQLEPNYQMLFSNTLITQIILHGYLMRGCGLWTQDAVAWRTDQRPSGQSSGTNDRSNIWDLFEYHYWFLT